MYTLENDRETSERLRKQNFQMQALKGLPTTTEQMPLSSDLMPEEPTAPMRQLTGSFKQLTTPSAKIPRAGRRAALAALTIACIGVFFTALDQTVVVTALPAIIQDLQVPITQLDHAAWIISAYLLGFIIAMPLMGRVSDIYGRRRILLLCLMIFGLGSILCGLAPILGQLWDPGFLSSLNIDTSSPGLVWLIAARFLQAIGGGAVVPVAMAIASDFYGKERRGLALGIIGGVTEAGGALGPLYGALIVQHSGWQMIFYLNVPVVILIGIAAWFLIPKGRCVREGIDWIGALLLGVALTCLSLGLAQQGTALSPSIAGSSAPQNNPIALILSLLFFVTFVLVERKVRWPVVDLKLFKRLAFSATSLVSLLVGAALIVAMADIPIYVDTVLQLPVLDSGLVLLRLTAMIPIGALLGGWLCGKITCRFTALLGLLFTAVGFFLMSRWPAFADWNQITISALTAGLGFGLVIAPISMTATNAVRAGQVGMGSAIVTALRMVGMMLGLAALTSWALADFRQLAATYPSLPSAATGQQFAQWSQGYAHHLILAAHTVYSAVFFFSMILCLVALIPAAGLWSRQVQVAEIEVEPEVGLVSLANLSNTLTIPGPRITVPLSLEDEPTVPMKKPFYKRRKMLLPCVGIVLLLILSGVFVALTWGPDDSGDTTDSSSSGNNPSQPITAPVAGPRLIQLALDNTALTSLFVSQLHMQGGALSNLNVTSTPDNGLVLKLNLNINTRGIQRVLPLEIDGKLNIDKQQNIHLNVTHLFRDGNDAGPTTAANMQGAMNQLLRDSVMPELRKQLKGVQLIAIHTSTAFTCGKGIQMLALELKAPPIQGIAAQSTPMTFCFKGPLDLNKLLPH